MNTCRKCGQPKGSGRCEPCRKVWLQKYRETLKYKTYSSEFAELYKRSEKRKEVIKRYRSTEKYKENGRRNSKKFAHSERGKQYINEYQKHYHKKYRSSDAYLSKLLKRKGLEPTPEILEAYKVQIQIKRKIYEIEREINASGNHVRPNGMLQGIDLNRSFSPYNAPDNQ